MHAEYTTLFKFSTHVSSMNSPLPSPYHDEAYDHSMRCFACIPAHPPVSTVASSCPVLIKVNKHDVLDSTLIAANTLELFGMDLPGPD